MRTQIHNSRQITQNNSLCLHCKLFLSLHTKMSPKCRPVCLQRFAEAICCFLLKIFCLIFLLQLSVVCTWALIPTWVSTHTRPWRPTNCWGSWAWKWTEQKRRWCLLWCHIVEVHAEKCLCDKHCWFFLLFSWHYLIFNKGFPHPCTAHLLFSFFLFRICCRRATIAATQWLRVLGVPDPTGETRSLSQGCHWDLGT